MTEKLSPEEIRDYWSHQAVNFKQAPDASWSDAQMIELEIKEILKFISDGDLVLDIGCGNGFSTVQFALNKNISIHGIDYIPQMIEEARARTKGLKPEAAKGRLSFEAGDILQLKKADHIYDKVIVTRVLINLRNWANQRMALRECVRVLKPGGLLLLSEATLQGFRKLNQFRNEWKLPDLPIPVFNEYLDEEMVVQEIAQEACLLNMINFASTYYVGTRVFKPLVSQILNQEKNVADPKLEWNRWFAQLPPWGDYGIQKLFVFQKRQ